MRSFAFKGPQNVGSLNAVATLSGGYGDSSDEYEAVVSGAFVGTLTFQGSLDGVTFYALKAEDAATGAIVSTTTAVGAWIIRNPPQFVRVQMTAYTSGTAVVTSAEVTIK